MKTLLVLTAATLCCATPISILSDSSSKTTLSAVQMMMDCCFLKGKVSLCDVLIRGASYCLADGKPPARQVGCVYHWHMSLYLVQCDAPGTPHNYELVKAMNHDSQLFKMYVHKDSDFMSLVIRSSRVWEPNICRAIVTVMQSFDKGVFYLGKPIFLDIGANIGFHSLCVMSYGYDVVSVEALPKNYEALKLSIADNRWGGQAHAYNIALTNVTTQEPLCFRSYSRNMKGASAVDVGKIADKTFLQGRGPCEYINTTTLDAIVETIRGGVCPVVLKIDVEGFEHFVLKGSTHLLETYTPCYLLIDFHVVLLKAAGAADPISTIELIQSYGYKLVSHSIADVMQIVARNGHIEIAFQHTSSTLQIPGSCWHRCMR